MHFNNLATELKSQKIEVRNDCGELESFISDTKNYQNYRKSRDRFDKYFTLLGTSGFFLSVVAFFAFFSTTGLHALVFPITLIFCGAIIWVFMCPGILGPRAVKPIDSLVSEDGEKLWAAVQEHNRVSKLLANTLEWVYSINHPEADLFKAQLEEEALPALNKSRLELSNALETWKKGFRLRPSDIVEVAEKLGGNLGLQNTIGVSNISFETLKASAHIELALSTRELVS